MTRGGRLLFGNGATWMDGPNKKGHLFRRWPFHGKIAYWMVRVNVPVAVMFELLLSVAVTVTV
jgi:hypothetical protein